MNAAFIANPYNAPGQVVMEYDRGYQEEEEEEEAQSIIVASCLCIGLLFVVGAGSYSYWKGLPESKDYLYDNLDL
jgi:hypothetical protein